MFRASFFSVCFLTLCFCNDVVCQNCPFSGVYGIADKHDAGAIVVPTMEKDGFYVGGGTFDSLLILKVNLSGIVEWKRTLKISGQFFNGLGSMICDTEGNLAIIAGTSQSEDPVFIIKYNPYNNTVLWTTGINLNTPIYQAAITEFGGKQEYIIGLNGTNDTLTNLFSLFKVDKSTGAISELSHWSSFSFFDYIQTIQYHDNFIYGVGTFSDNDIFTRRRHGLMKIDYQTGNIIWFKLGHLPGNLNQTANFLGNDFVIHNNSIYSLYDGNLIGEKRKIYIQKTNLNGGVTWVKEYGLPEVSSIAYSLIVSENGLVIYGQHNIEENDFALFKTDFNGELLWATSIESPLKIHGKFDMFNSHSDLPSSIIELNNALIFTKWGRLVVNDDDLIFGSTDLFGHVNTSCMKSQTIPMTVKEVNNTVFYNVSPDIMDIEVEFNSAKSSFYVSDIPALLECNFEKIENVNASICNGEVFEGYFQSGTYIDTFSLMDGCDSIRILDLTVLPTVMNTITREICSGDSFEGYSHSGVFSNTFVSSTGCDSVRVLYLFVNECLPIIHYDLEACRSYMEDASHMDFSEFTPAYPNALPCADVSAIHVTEASSQNKHSCTPGIDGNVAMCVGSLTSCTYSPGDPASVIIEFTVTPDQDSIVRITGFEFFEKSPNTYSWIDGDSGPNNSPAYYGIRILKNGIEIFRDEQIQTTPAWTLQSFDFINDDLFKIDSTASFRIELLPYCPDPDNAADVFAWDIDEIKVFGGCVREPPIGPVISGIIKTIKDIPIESVNVLLAPKINFIHSSDTTTNEIGFYIFGNQIKGSSYFLKASKDTDHLNGVNVIDLVHIQKHLLGTAPFISLDQYVAADVNNNHVVSAKDLVDIQKLLLGKTYEFPNNESWRFGMLPQNMTGGDLSNFKEVKVIESLSKFESTCNFVGIKVGDVNGDVQLFNTPQPIESRSDELFIPIVEQEQHKSGKTALTFKSSEEILLSALQFEVWIEDFISIEGGRLEVINDNYHYLNGQLRFIWSSGEERLIEKNDILFTLILDSDEEFQKLEFIEEELVPMLYTQDLSSRKIDLSFIADNIAGHTDQFAVEPNPFYSKLNVKLNLVRASKVRINFFDSSGKMIFGSERLYSAGIFNELIDSKALGAGSGVVYCRITSDSSAQTFKIVKLER